MIDFADYQKLFIVDAYSCPKNCHVVVTMRHPDIRHWVFALVRSPLDINFGDMIYAKCDDDGFFEEGTFYLYRGPHLVYHLITDAMPEFLAQHLYSESPGVTMYSDEDGPWETY